MELIRCLFIWVLKIYIWKVEFIVKLILVFVVVLDFCWVVLGLGFMFFIVILYGESGLIFCGLKLDGLYFVVCYGLNVVIIYVIFVYIRFLGLIGGDGFVCGFFMDLN